LQNHADLIFTQVIAWKSDARARELCVMKGQPDVSPVPIDSDVKLG